MALGVLNNLSAIYAENNLNNTNNSLQTVLQQLSSGSRINSGSARVIAFNAASRSPRLIASSTVRTAPRISVRRDLLMMVRRAILRVAFFAEVVLAMISKILRR